jgi:iron complex outermembrane receptor protein
MPCYDFVALHSCGTNKIKAARWTCSQIPTQGGNQLMSINASVDMRFIKKLLCGASLSAIATVIGGQAQAQSVPQLANTLNVNAVVSADSATKTNKTKETGGAPANLVQLAQADTADTRQAAATTTESVVVTGSRIQNGNSLPTPVTIMSAVDLTATTPTSIPDALNKLPNFSVGRTANSATNANGRGWSDPGSYLNLRGFGAIRTLVLQDGNRVSGTFYDTTVDTDMLPQMLIERVEVVSGGASAVYGSDAITGVINFITNKHFNGLKGYIQGGVTTYGDNRSSKAGLAWGADILDRGHIEVAVDYLMRDMAGVASRPFSQLSPAVLGNGTAATPYVMGFDARQSNASFGGLVTTGPFKGQQFLPGGNLGAFNPGTPTVNTNTAIGGDGGWVNNMSLLPAVVTGQAYGRFDYDFSDDLKGYVSFHIGDKRNYLRSQITTNTTAQYPITIYSGNAFLTAAEQAQLTATGTQSFNMNRFDQDLIRGLGLSGHTLVESTTMGLEGKLSGDWAWDTHYTHGLTKNDYITNGNINTNRFYAAIDAVKDPISGNIKCRVTMTNPGLYPGCQPLNLFGQNSYSATADAYIRDRTWTKSTNTMDDFGANMTGTAFQGWAGPVKVAIGAEYRLNSLVATTSNPNTTFYADPNVRLAPYGTYNAGNGGTAATNPTGSYPSSDLVVFKELQSPGTGSESISEGNIEVDVPLLKDLPLIELLSFNGAARYTNYSTHGNGTLSASFAASTWKTGIEWQVIDDLKLRASMSRDIRAPTLWDLYQQQIVSSSFVTDPLTKVGNSLNTVAGGNPNLKPEKSVNTTAGVIYAPGWFPGFSASIDYYNVKISNGIGGVNGLSTQAQNICLGSPNGSSPMCALVQRPISYNSTDPANYPTLIYTVSQNIALNEVRGFDVEANYSNELDNIISGWPGAIRARVLWNHQPVLYAVSIPGSQQTNAAGTGATPKDHVSTTLAYAVGNWSVDLLENWYDAQHTQSDPTQISLIKVPAYFRSDVNISYQFEDAPMSVYLNVSNVFNDAGTASGGCASAPGLCYGAWQTPYMDVVGRSFAVGLKFEL